MGEQDYNGTKAYARAKRAQLALVHRWSRTLGPAGITVNAMHPGWVDTPGVEASLPTFRRIMKPLLRDGDAGSDTIVWLAASPEAEGLSGAFVHDRAPRPEHKLGRTKLESAEERRREDELWALVTAAAGLPADALTA
jgi:dehydrogenase/reductase SDR family protein 12